MSEHDEENVASLPRPGASAVAGVGSSGGGGRKTDEQVKSDEAALRRVANTGGVGAFAVAEAAAGGRRGGPRIRRTASARRRARERAGLDNGGEGGEGTGEPQINPDELIAADVEMQEMMIEDEEDDTLSFWQLDKTDKIICGGVACLVVALIVILAMAMT